MSQLNVQEYIDKHQLQKKVEDVLNICVKSKPDEPLSYMVCPSLRVFAGPKRRSIASCG